MLAAPRRVLTHRRIINLHAVLSGRPLRANLALQPLLTALTLRASITLGANRASFANRPLRAGIALLALYTLNALLTLGAALASVALFALNTLFALRPDRPLRANRAYKLPFVGVLPHAGGCLLRVAGALIGVLCRVPGILHRPQHLRRQLWRRLGILPAVNARLFKNQVLHVAACPLHALTQPGQHKHAILGLLRHLGRHVHSIAIQQGHAQRLLPARDVPRRRERQPVPPGPALDFDTLRAKAGIRPQHQLLRGGVVVVKSQSMYHHAPPKNQ